MKQSRQKSPEIDLIISRNLTTDDIADNQGKDGVFIQKLGQLAIIWKNKTGLLFTPHIKINWRLV